MDIFFWLGLLGILFITIWCGWVERKLDKIDDKLEKITDILNKLE